MLATVTDYISHHLRIRERFFKWEDVSKIGIKNDSGVYWT